MTDHDPPTPETDNPTEVISALAWVTANLGGIAKRQRPPGGGGGNDREFYAYRGIDEIAAAAQPLLGRAGVVIVPTEAVIVTVDEIQVNGRPWTDTTVSVAWTIYGPGGSWIPARTQGIGRDNSDKGYNKAATQAFKNLLLRLLCIGDPQDDADAPAHQNNATERPAPAPAPVELDDPGRLLAVQVFERLRAMNADTRDHFAVWRETNPGGLSVPAMTADPEWTLRVNDALDDAEQIAATFGGGAATVADVPPVVAEPVYDRDPVDAVAE